MPCFLLCLSYVMETKNRTQDQKSPVIVSPWNFVFGTSIAYYLRIVLKYLSWNLSMLCITITLYVFLKCFCLLQWAPRLILLTLMVIIIVRSDHPSVSKRVGVCCYFKESLPIRILKITPMTECLVLEMLYNNKLVIVSVIYRSPSQSS